MSTEGTVDGTYRLADGKGLVGDTEEDFALGVVEDGAYLLNLAVVDGGVGRPSAVCPLAGTVCHETGYIRMACKESGEGSTLWERIHENKDLGGYAYVLYWFGAALGVAAHHGLCGDVCLVAFIFELVATSLLAVALDDGYIPFAIGHASGADSRRCFLCP